MNSCLIVGHHSTFSGLIIDRLYKEGWQVYTLSSDDKYKHPHVFYHYCYEFTADNLLGVVESAHPDVVIYLGAFDLSYASPSEAKLKGFIGEIESLLYYSGSYGVRHFVYLSSEEIFDGEGFEVDIAEDTTPVPKTRAATVRSQGEMLASRFNSLSPMEVTVLRLDHLYFIPENALECTDICSSMCLKALKDEKIEINYRNTFTMLYANDAVEAIFRLISAENRQHNIYQISSEEYVVEDALAKMIDSHLDTPLITVDNPSGLSRRNRLSSKRFDEEFDFKVRMSYTNAVPMVVESMLARRSSFLDNRDKMAAGLEKLRKVLRFIVVYGEVFAGVLLATFLTFFFSESQISGVINFFLLVTVLFASFYGTAPGIASATLSSIAYFLIRYRESSGFEMLADMGTYLWIAQVFIVALAVGFVRDKLQRIGHEMDDEVDFLHGRISDISSINTSNVQLKNFFETKLLDSNESVGYIYNIISRMDMVPDSGALFEATSILSELIATEDISVYQVTGGAYLRIVASTSDVSRSLGMSIKRSDYQDIFKVLEEKHIYVNRKLENDMPHIIGRLNNSEKNISFIVMLWNLPYDHMTMYYVNLVRVICELVGNAVARSARMLDLTRSERMISHTSVMNEEAFKKIVDVYRDARDRQLTESVMLEFDMQGLTVEQWDEKLKGMFRFTDSIGLAKGGTVIRVLLTNTNGQNARFVIKRLHDKGLEPEVFV